MAFDEGLAARMRGVLDDQEGVAEKRMFGGLAFLIDGHMAVCATEGGLMVRVPRDETEDVLGLPHVGPMEMSRGPVQGWVLVDESGIEADDDLRSWIDRGVAYARSLPPK